MRGLLKRGVRAAGRALANIGVDSQRFGPPRGVCTSSHLEGTTARIHLVGGGGTIERGFPRSLDGTVHPKFERDLRREAPATFVAEIDGGRVTGQYGVVISGDDRIVADLCPRLWATPGDFRELNRLKLPRADRVGGRVAVLGGSGGDGYFHWLYDVFPKIDLIRRCGQEPDLWLVGNHSIAFVRETVALAGIPAELVRSGEARTDVAAETLIVPSLPGLVGNPPAWVVDFLRATLLPAPGPVTARGRRLYVSRSDTRRRRVANEAEVQAVLHAMGFETVVLSGMSVASQAALFDSAEVIVAPHGAGLANLAFCRRGTVVIELFNPAYVNVCYWSISNLVGLDYWYLIGPSQQPGELPPGVDALPIDVPINDLLATVELALSQVPAGIP